MRITGITSRIVESDVSEAWGEGRIPEGITTTVWRYSMDVIHTDEGIDGYTAQFGGLGEGRAVGHALHEAYAGDLIGEDPLHGEALWRKLRTKNRHMYNVSDAILGAIDVGLWDIRGKVAGQPVAVMLGLARTSIPTYATARTINPVPEEVFEEARTRKAEGYRGFKIQFWDGLERDVPRFRAAREAVGPDYPLMEDAASGYSYTQAVAAGRELERLGFRWFEEPLPDRQVDQLRRLSHELDIPILATEIVRLEELPEYLRHGAVDIVRGDVLIKSGITGVRKAAAAAELFGYDLEVHAIGTPILDVANLHVALSIANCSFSEGFDPFFEAGLQGAPLAIDPNGERHLPAGPGLGVDPDWNWIDNHTIEEIRSPAA